MYHIKINGKAVLEFDDYELVTIVNTDTGETVMRLIKGVDMASRSVSSAFNQSGQVVAGSQINGVSSVVQSAIGDDIVQSAISTRGGLVNTETKR